jgi:hypothetical protein
MEINMNTEEFNNTKPSPDSIYAFETFFTGMYWNMDKNMLLSIIETFSRPQDRTLTVREAAYRTLQLKCARSVAKARNIA